MAHALPRRAGLLIAVALAAAAAGPAPGHAVAPAPDRLPDLDQELPSGLDISMQQIGGRRSYRLGFGSGVRNIGTGPLVIDGHRSAHVRTMVGDQLIARADGTQRRVGGVGRLRYVVSPDHQHWHLLGFDRYELRRAGGRHALVRDRKSGFCLGDRYRVTSRPVPGAAARPTYTSRCGLRQPGRRQVREGISVGYGDFYAAHLEYQDLPLDRLRAGRYVLVHRVNAGRHLRESDYGNDASSLLLDLRWRNGVPRIVIRAQCPDSARCDRPAGRAAAGAVAARLPLTRALPGAAARGMLCDLRRSAALTGGV